MSDNELGLFLRTRREAITPAQVGLPAGPRRRAAGLRRSEVAGLAGVSVEYVTRLEQGRDRHPSPQILSALADALRLRGAERAHLYTLSKAADPGFNCRGRDAVPTRTVRPTVHALLQRFEGTPAVLVNKLGDVLDHTAAYARLVGPIGVLDPESPNLARYVFTDPRAHDAYPDWDHVADEQVASLKHGPFTSDPHVVALFDELTVTAGDAFTRRVKTVPGFAKSTGIVRLIHPEVGTLRLAYEVLALSVDDQQQLIVQLPADEATAAALDRLVRHRSQPLRVVG